MSNLQKLRAKIDLLNLPLVQEIIKDLDPCLDIKIMKIYYQNEIRKLTTPLVSKYRQLDLEEAIENEKKDSTFICENCERTLPHSEVHYPVTRWTICESCADELGEE